MLSSYRDLDYSYYNDKQRKYCCIRYDTQYHSYKGELYGKKGLGFYFPGFQTLGFSKFKESSNDAVALLSVDKSIQLIRGHIINAALDGEVTNENLVPLSYAANARHKTSEEKVKRMINHLSRLGNDKIYAVGYEVVVDADYNGIPRRLALEANVYYLIQRNELFLASETQLLSDKLSGSGRRIDLPVTDSFNPLL